MTRFLGRYTRALTVAAATLALTLPTASIATATAAEADGPDYQQPTVGECHNYTAAGRMKASDTSAVVDCGSTHTAQVVAVGKIPANGSWDFGGRALQRVVSNSCVPGLRTALGQPDKVIDKSAYSISIFIPTQAQRDHGALWVRCDVVRLGGKKLLQLASPGDLLADRRLGNDEARCLIKNGSTTACAKGHVWRAKQVLTMPFKKYPSQNKAGRFAATHCKAAKQGRPWYSSWRGPDFWKAGNHQLVCYVRTKK